MPARTIKLTVWTMWVWPLLHCSYATCGCRNGLSAVAEDPLLALRLLLCVGVAGMAQYSSTVFGMAQYRQIVLDSFFRHSRSLCATSRTLDLPPNVRA
jgi:hypothetical protein